MLDIYEVLISRRTTKFLYPKDELVMQSFASCSLADVNVVIIGQDPYPNDKANGIAFGSSNGHTPSLNVLQRWIGKTIDPTLLTWTAQGVLLLNSALTVEVSGRTMSHSTLWKEFVEHAVKLCSDKGKVVFALLGNTAKELEYVIDTSTNEVHCEVHPASMCGNRNPYRHSEIFNDINSSLIRYRKTPIVW